jgi:hypothetical protein
MNRSVICGKWVLTLMLLFTVLSCAKKSIETHYEIKRFVKYDNGIVYDKETRLEWYIGPDKNMNWFEARKWADELDVAGGLWRMPRIYELSRLAITGQDGEKRLPLVMGYYRWVWSGDYHESEHVPSCAMFFGQGGWTPNNAYTSAERRVFAVRSACGR